MPRQLYAYHISPMDFGWSLMSTTQQFMRTLLDYASPEISPKRVASNLADFGRFCEEALEAGDKVGWEGDFRGSETPRVMVLPGEVYPYLALIWKQDNNGSTFVVSEVPMPWLDELVGWEGGKAVVEFPGSGSVIAGLDFNI